MVLSCWHRNEARSGVGVIGWGKDIVEDINGFGYDVITATRSPNTLFTILVPMNSFGAKVRFWCLAHMKHEYLAFS